MVYNELGKTGMKVSNLSFGASSLGGVFHDIKEQEGIRAVHTAVDNGINFIDVSPYYGHYKAETVLAGSHDCIISVKVDGQEIHSSTNGNTAGADNGNDPATLDPDLAKKITVRELYDYAMQTPIEELEFMIDSLKLNKAL